MKIGILASHPIQYQAPLFRALAAQVELEVWFAHRQDAAGQASAGYGVAFDWDVDLLGGYASHFLPNVAVHPSVERFFGCDTPAIATHIRSAGYDGFVVMGWNLKCYWQAVRACRRAGVPVLARGDSQLRSPRSWWLKTAKRLVFPLLLSRFDGFFAVGKRSAEYLRHYAVPARKIFVAPHVIDSQRFAKGAMLSASELHRWRADLGLPVDRAIVLFVGRLIAWKRVDDLIDALAHPDLIERVGLLVVGDGPDRNRLHERMAAKGVTGIFAGFVNQANLPVMHALAQVLVLPSNSNETWGLVVNEAIAAGTPVVVSDVAGCADELAVPGETGERFPMGDIAQMVVALCTVLKSGRAGYQQGLQKSAEQFSPETSAKAMVAALESLHGERMVTLKNTKVQRMSKSQ